MESLDEVVGRNDGWGGMNWWGGIMDGWDEVVGRPDGRGGMVGVGREDGRGISCKIQENLVQVL
jgi:hypothetical protein